jgi:hypothetical protein
MASVLTVRSSMAAAQSAAEQRFEPTVSVRLSFLLFPPATPLLTVEVSTFDTVTVQLETNFIDTHGCNLKYFLDSNMDGAYVFGGSALVAKPGLRKDGELTWLPYVGGGYAYRFGSARRWDVDTRFGFGRTVNADSDRALPIVKAGIGYVF